MRLAEAWPDCLKMGIMPGAAGLLPSETGEMSEMQGTEQNHGTEKIDEMNRRNEEKEQISGEEGMP